MRLVHALAGTEKQVNVRFRSSCSALLGAVALCGSAHAEPVIIPVESSDTAAWIRSDGEAGTSMPPGGPTVWNTRFLAAIPPGMTNISFTLDTLLPDDKAVVHLNDGFIADAVVLRSNGAAAGPGTFDFGLGAGNQAYTFVGFTPGTSFALPDGTTDVTLLVYMNDTGTGDPAAPPLASVFINSSVSVSGDLAYDNGVIFRDGFEDAAP